MTYSHIFSSTFLLARRPSSSSLCTLVRPPPRHVRYVRLYTPRSTSVCARLTAWMTGSHPEYFDSKFVAQGRGREGASDRCLFSRFSLHSPFLVRSFADPLRHFTKDSSLLPGLCSFPQTQSSFLHCICCPSSAPAVTRVQSSGVVKIVFNCMMKNMTSFGYSIDDKATAQHTSRASARAPQLQSGEAAAATSSAAGADKKLK